VRLAITCFTATGLETKVVSGPEPFEAAKDKLRAAMRDGHAEGVYEIWTSDGISDRFTFKTDSTPEPIAAEPKLIAPEPEPTPTPEMKRRR
jgi:hypothetical protein